MLYTAKNVKSLSKEKKRNHIKIAVTFKIKEKHITTGIIIPTRRPGSFWLMNPDNSLTNCSDLPNIKMCEWEGNNN